MMCVPSFNEDVSMAMLIIGTVGAPTAEGQSVEFIQVIRVGIDCYALAYPFLVLDAKGFGIILLGTSDNVCPFWLR